MTNEELQSRVEFIIEQQAQFAVNMERLREAQEKAEARVGRVEGAIVTLVNMIGEVVKAQKHTEAKVAELAESQKRMDAALIETNERLNTFIAVVENYISRGINGEAS